MTSGIDVPYRTLVIKADPDYERDARAVPEYEFTRRRFTANPSERGAFNVLTNGVFEPNSFPSAVYVGQIGGGVIVVPPVDPPVDPPPTGDGLPTLPPGYAFVVYQGQYVTLNGNYLIQPIT